MKVSQRATNYASGSAGYDGLASLLVINVGILLCLTSDVRRS